MKISVVIPTADRPYTINKAIEKLLENTVKPHEIIVVDQSQNDLTFHALTPFIESGSILYVKETISGASRARNIGWEKAQGDIIAFTDDDALVDSKWIENIRQTFEHNTSNIGVLGGKVIPVYEEKDPTWSIPARWSHLLPSYDQGDTIGLFREGAFPATVNYSVSRFLLEKFKGFNEDIGPHAGRKIQIPGEDAELALRLKQNGFDIIYNPSCIVYHPVPLSRQNLVFLNTSIFGEGARSAFFQIKKNSSTVILLLLLLKCIVKYLYFGLAKLIGAKKDEELWYLHGRILVLFKYGILNQDLSYL